MAVFNLNFLTTNLSDIVWYRGDSFPIEMIVSNVTTGEAVDITGYTFLMTCSSVKSPTDTTSQLFQITGSIVDAASGQVNFIPSTTQTDISRRKNFYDVQSISPDGHAATIAKFKFTVNQDITKAVTSATEYSTSFDNSDLSANILTVSHDLGDMYPVVTVYNNNAEQVSVTVVPVDENTYTIDFGAEITGTWFITTRVLSNRYTQTFSNDDLIDNVLSVTHALGTAYPAVSVYDANDELVSVTVVSTGVSSFTIDFGGAITGTCHLTAI